MYAGPGSRRVGREVRWLSPEPLESCSGKLQVVVRRGRSEGYVHDPAAAGLDARRRARGRPAARPERNSPTPGKPGTTAPTCELTRMVMEGLEAAGEIDLVSLDPVEPVHERMSLRRPPGSKQLLAGHTEGTDETGERVFVGKDPGQTATGAPPGTVTPARRASACWVRSPPRAARPGAGRTPRTGPPRPRHCPAWTLRRRRHVAPNILRTSRRTRGPDRGKRVRRRVAQTRSRSGLGCTGVPSAGRPYRSRKAGVEGSNPSVGFGRYAGVLEQGAAHAPFASASFPYSVRTRAARIASSADSRSAGSASSCSSKRCR
jgi:hypothetical protein